MEETALTSKAFIPSTILAQIRNYSTLTISLALEFFPMTKQLRQNYVLRRKNIKVYAIDGSMELKYLRK
jgi:hypothetical protein